jgi:four helix bundle protein
MAPAPKLGMTTETKRPGAHQFVALEIALEIVVALRDAVGVVRTHDVDLAKQIVRSASSIAANVGEGRRRVGRDRLHFFRIAAGSAEETRVHLRIALAWGWLRSSQVDDSLRLIDRELALLWGLTHRADRL